MPNWSLSKHPDNGNLSLPPSAQPCDQLELERNTNKNGGVA